jgi:hypothetical protein
MSDRSSGTEQLHEVLTSPQRFEVFYIGLGADLAGAMIGEFKCLETNNSRLALSMATTGALAQQRLLSLLRIIEWLRLTHDAKHAVDLITQAKALLLRLAGELEQLAADAGCEVNGRRGDGTDQEYEPRDCWFRWSGRSAS